jgi:hypothetical protein
MPRPNGCSGILVALLMAASVAAAADSSVVSGDTEQEALSNWPCFLEITPPAGNAGPWVDFVLPSAVFAKARFDLLDLLLYADDQREVPYALRVRVEQNVREPFPASRFNETEGPEGSTELTLDLQRNDIEHNEVELKMAGENYRRLVELEGSDDGNTWRPVQKEPLVFYVRGDTKLRDDSISYPPSRFRYLHVRLHRDPLVDKASVRIEDIQVFRRVEVPGERPKWPAEKGPREPVRTDYGPGSAWILSLGGDQIPVDRIELEIAENDFARDFTLEAGGLPESRQSFAAIASGVLQRKAGEKTRPLVVTFPETRAARLRLLVTDNRNRPLDIQTVSYLAPARQIVFATPSSPAPLKLYFGYVKAGEPAYDFARNLPERLIPEPMRATVGTPTDNPHYLPEPLPLTERWPALIYAVLGTVIVVLGIILISLSRAAIRTHDRIQAAGVPAEPEPVGRGPTEP